MSLRIVFMGTPTFAVSVLRAMLDRGETVVGVICQPDKAGGRGNALIETPVKELACERGLPCHQPVKVRDQAFVDLLRSFAPDLAVVAAYGRILPPAVLSLPRLGCINVHASLLPRYRGAAPIQWAVVRGEPETGITIMQMDEGMDSGDTLLVRRCPIGEQETAGELYDRLAALGAQALLEALDALRAGTLIRTPQNHALATTAPMLRKEDGLIAWDLPPGAIHCFVRGMTPWPGAFTYLRAEPLKIFPFTRRTEGDTGQRPGTVLASGPDSLVVSCAGGSVEVTEVQAPGRRRMQVRAFLAGHSLAPGTVLGEGTQE